MKKIYSHPVISKILLDSEINLVLMSVECPPLDPELMMMQEEMETSGDIYSQFINPLRWFK